ncbi:MAG: hypothetical protein AB3N15_06715 [Paracoccaceae bacterium]
MSRQPGLPKRLDQNRLKAASTMVFVGSETLILIRFALRNLPAFVGPMSDGRSREDGHKLALSIFRYWISVIAWEMSGKDSARVKALRDMYERVLENLNLPQPETAFRMSASRALARHVADDGDWESQLSEAVNRTNSYARGSTKANEDPDVGVGSSNEARRITRLVSDTLEQDLDKLRHELRTAPLWVQLPDEFASRLAKLWSLLSDDSSFRFWIDWYNGFLEGKPVDWDLQRQVAQIDDEIWDTGPKAVAREIARLQTEIALGELPRAMVRTSIDRHGIGGNHPPDDIEDSPEGFQDISMLETSITLVWNAADGIEEETASDTPNRDRVAACLQALETGLAAVAKWCGRKADLTVDTLIKWGIPAGGAYLVTQPEKVEALIRAVERWLKFLP